MALKVMSLMATTLSSTVSTFTPGTGKGAIVKSILFVNRDTVNAQTVTAKLVKNTLPSGTASLCPDAMSIPSKSSISLDTEITLSDGDQLEISGGTLVDCIVSGMVRDN